MEINFLHTSPIQIRFNDVDMLGHATNSVYPQYFDLGRMAYFEKVLGERMDWRFDGLIMVNITIDFVAQIKLYDSVVVRTKIIRLGNKSLDMVQDLYNETTGKIVAKSKGVMVGYNGTEEVSIPIPIRWRELIVAFESDVLF